METKNDEGDKAFMFKRIALYAVPVLILIGGFALVRGVSTPHAQNDSCGAPASWTREWTETDFCQSNIDFDTVISGGPPRDGIPAVTNPDMNTIDEAQEWLSERSPVIVVEIDGEARAYPHAVLMWHEIANDEFNGVPISVTFCPLCNSSIVFDRRVDGEVLEFGVSGKLRNSDMIMYDRTSFSWWQQLTGEGIVGEYTGTVLDVLPSQVIGFGQFAERYPDGLVMSRNTGFNRNYGVNPYRNYDQTERPFLFRGDIDDRLPATEHVLAGTVGDEAIAYPFAALAQEFVINDIVDGNEVLAVWQPGTNSSLDQASIDNSRDIGTAALFDRELNGQILTFSYDADTGTITDDQTGSTWNLFGEAIAGELEGESLRQLVAAPHFWFAWAAFHPQTSVYGL